MSNPLNTAAALVARHVSAGIRNWITSILGLTALVLLLFNVNLEISVALVAIADIFSRDAGTSSEQSGLPIEPEPEPAEDVDD